MSDNLIVFLIVKDFYVLEALSGSFMGIDDIEKWALAHSPHDFGDALSELLQVKSFVGQNGDKLWLLQVHSWVSLHLVVFIVIEVGLELSDDDSGFLVATGFQ